MSFNAIRENIILAKISEFTVTLCMLGKFALLIIYKKLTIAFFFRNTIMIFRLVSKFGSRSGHDICLKLY